MTWLESWRRKYRSNADEAERNSLMDSGWSAGVADACTHRRSVLLGELLGQLITLEQPCTDADRCTFDWDLLAEIQTAARIATGKEKA